MLSPALRDVISGQRRGLWPSLLRGVLRVAEVPYGFGVAWRNWRYDAGHAVRHRVSVPVISVGNLTMGGVGKTPMVEWLARWLRQHEVRVSVISRGYGAAEGAVNDEALVLEANLPDVPHLQNPDRVAAARVAIEELAAQAIVLDDAFQHRRIERDLDLVLLDALEPFGYGHLAPRGLLREPVRNLARAHVAVLTRADAVSNEVREAIRARVARLAPQAAWVETSHAPRALLNAGGQEQSIEMLRGKAVAAFCGLGNPAGFRHTLESLGCQIAAWREFPDHHRYTRDDIVALTDWAKQAEVQAVVCTQKDLVKIQVDMLSGIGLWAITIGLEILVGREALEERLAPCLTAALAVPDNAW